MSGLWIRDRSGWALASLCEDLTYELSIHSSAPVRIAKRKQVKTDSAILLPWRDGNQQKWIVMGGCKAAGIFINGSALSCSGIQVLKDRDEILLNGGTRIFYSAARSAAVEPFPGAENTVSCVRCRNPIDTGAEAIRCPNAKCGAWYHASDTSPCWTYSTTCAICKQPTEKGAAGGASFTPEGL
jgi:hypothetical protein